MRPFRSHRRGSTAVEYALVAGVLVLTTLIGFLQLRDQLGASYDRSGAQIGHAVQGAAD